MPITPSRSKAYRVSPELIDRVRSGNWNPDANDEDRELRNALAARGYWQAYQEVRKSVSRVLANENPGTVADENHGTWYREMFAPSVTAGLLKPAELAGYRSGQVYIRRSMHVPPQRHAVRDLMPAFFELLTEETDPAARVVLGHFIFVYIHPYMDGNGRMGPFPDECHACIRRVSVDSHPARKTGRLHGCIGRGERIREHCALRRFSRAPCRRRTQRKAHSQSTGEPGGRRAKLLTNQRAVPAESGGGRRLMSEPAESLTVETARYVAETRRLCRQSRANLSPPNFPIITGNGQGILRELTRQRSKERETIVVRMGRTAEESRLYGSPFASFGAASVRFCVLSFHRARRRGV